MINSISLHDMRIDMRHIRRVLAVLAAGVGVLACSPEWIDEMEVDFSVPSGNPGDRLTRYEERDVLLLYSAGYNSLTSYLSEDIEDLKSGWLPGSLRNDNVLLVYSHLLGPSGKYSEPSSPVLMRFHASSEGVAVCDTLKIYDSSVISSSPAQFGEVMNYVKREFPAAGYGLVFSSHATGYLPAGFYQDPASYIYKGDSDRQMKSVWHGAVASPYVEMEYDPSLPAVKSIGQDVVQTSDSRVSYEMELADFADAIPMKLDYILFDACLMGGIEVAYELRGKTSLVGFSQAEVLAEGLNYKTLASRLLADDTSDLVAVCRDYFEQYDILDGANRSATVSAIDCDELEPLAELCAELFERYRGDISALPWSRVQRYYRSRYHWFYDLESILVEAGISSEEKHDLYEALEKCVLYKGATPSFMNSFDIAVFSGFSMYLPSHGNTELDKYYKTLEWNKATGLVK